MRASLRPGTDRLGSVRVSSRAGVALAPCRDRSSPSRRPARLRRTLLARASALQVAARGRADPGRLLPPPRQEAEAVPHRRRRARCRSATAPSRRTPSARTCTTTCSPRSTAPQHQILFETYIWKGDEVGERFKRALTEAADRGRRGLRASTTRSRTSWSSPAVQAVRARGSRCCEYPVYNAGWRFFDLRRYGRDHRKILVVDDEVGFVGGYNIGSPYATEWRDTHVRITGPGVWDLKRAVRRLLEPQPAQAARPASARCCWRPPPTWEPRIRVHRNVPRLWMFPIRSMYLEAINRATRNIWMTHAYFIPDPDFVDALKAAAPARGRRTPAAAGQVQPRRRRLALARLLRPAARRRRADLPLPATRWCTPRPPPSTASWSTVGTANIDRLSMTGNYEINVEVIDADDGRRDGADLRDRPDQLRGAHPGPSGRRGASTAASPSWCSAPLRPLL